MDESKQVGAPGADEIPARMEMRRSRMPPALDALSRRIIACAIEVHRALGPGFVESVYERALALEFTHAGLPYACQHPVAVSYRNVLVGEHRLDFLVAESIVVELKAVDALSSAHEAQVISYLKAGSWKLGLLMNFNVDQLRRGLRRIVHPDYYR